MRKEYYTEKQYPMLCPKCNKEFIIKKEQVIFERDDVKSSAHYYIDCPFCNRGMYSWAFGTLVREYNPGWINNHKMVIYDGK